MIYPTSIRPVHGGNLAWAAAVAGVSPGSLLDFSASINPLGPPASVLQAIEAALTDLRHYPDPGYGRLCEAIGAHHGVDPSWVLPGNGAAELLTWATRDLSRDSTEQAQASEVAVCGLLTPAFGDYGRALAAFGGQCLAFPLLHLEAPSNVVGLPPDLLTNAEQVQGVLINNPHNPTGAMFSAELILPLLETSRLVVVDEAFMDFVVPSAQQSLMPWVGNHKNLVILRSLTKFYSLPGLRIGYAIGHPDRLRQWQQWRDPWPVNTLAEAATIAALQDVAFQKRTWGWLSPARDALFKGLRMIPGLHPLEGRANFLLVRSEYSVPPLQELLLKRHRILIRDCLSFPELGDCYFRIAVRTTAENDALLDALGEVVAKLA